MLSFYFEYETFPKYKVALRRLKSTDHRIRRLQLETGRLGSRTPNAVTPAPVVLTFAILDVGHDPPHHLRHPGVHSSSTAKHSIALQLSKECLIKVDSSCFGIIGLSWWAFKRNIAALKPPRNVSISNLQKQYGRVWFNFFLR